MKKLLAIILTLAMTFGLCASFTGCGEEEKEQKLYEKYDLSEYIVLPDYDKYEYEKPIPKEVTEVEMQRGIEKDLAYYGIEYKNTGEGTVYEGDAITIDYVGTLEDGTSPDDMKAENYAIILGEGNLIEGFEEALYGAEVGSTVIFETTFPEPYYVNTELSGMGVTFEITITSKDTIELPELTDRFIQKAHDLYYQTVEEYMADVKKYYEELHEKEAKQTVINDIYARIIEETEVLKYPEDELAYETMLYVEQQVKHATDAGIPWNVYLSDYVHMTEEEFTAQADEYAKFVVKQEMVIYAIAEKEGLEITDEEFEDGKITYLEEAAKMTEVQFEEYAEMTFDEFAKMYNFEKQLLKEEMLDVIYTRVVK